MFVGFIDLHGFKSVVNHKILDMSKFKTFADDNMARIPKFVFQRIENILEKGENAVYQHFLFFPTLFSKLFFPGDVKNRDHAVKYVPLPNKKIQTNPNSRHMQTTK